MEKTQDSVLPSPEYAHDREMIDGKRMGKYTQAKTFSKENLKVSAILQVRFPTASVAEIHEVLRMEGGHGGKAQKLLLESHADEVHSKYFKDESKKEGDFAVALSEFTANLQRMSEEATTQDTAKVLARSHDHAPTTEAQVVLDREKRPIGDCF